MLKIKNNLSAIFIIILIIVTFNNLDLKNIFSKRKVNKNEDLKFLEFIIDKYYANNLFNSPKFYFNPHELGLHTLLPGFRLYNFRLDGELLIKNKNNLIQYNQINFVNYNDFYLTKEYNIHGIFFSIKDLSKESFISINDVLYNIEFKNLLECKKILNQKNIFINNIEKSKNDINQLNNCYYFEFKHNTEKISIKFKLNNKLILENITNIFLYGNDVEVASYKILEVSEDNYNFFFAKIL